MKVEVAEIGMHNAAQVADAGLEAIGRGDSDFDLSAVHACDSSAVAVVLAWQRAAAARGAVVRLSGMPAALASLATVYGVAPLLGLAESAD